MAAEDDDIEFSWVRQTARRVGTVVHEALEHFGRGALPAAAGAAAPARAAGIAAAGAGRGRRGGARRRRTRAGRVARHARGHPGRWLFDPAHRDAHSELALSGVRARPDHQRGDRPHLRRPRMAHAGWSTSRPVRTRAAISQAFWTRKRCDTRRSCGVTRTWRARLGPEPVRAGLYFPLLAAWREVDVTS